MNFGRDVQRFVSKVQRMERDIHNGVCDLAFSSIVEGSPVTGAPGQPVDTGNLKGSWQNVVEGPLTRLIMTKVGYAPFIEDGGNKFGPFRLRSAVGGFHSLALTRAGWQRIVQAVAQGARGG